MTQVTRVDVVAATLPLRFSFGHALAERKETTNVYARVELADGTAGYGEGVPREYVTGETAESAFAALSEFAEALAGTAIDGADDVPRVLDGAAPGNGANSARCALELAVLDACGRYFGRSAASWLSPTPADTVRYDAVIPFSSPKKIVVIALAIRALAVTQVKVKVGGDLEHDVATLQLLRRLLGGSVDIRVDANCGWQSADEALAALETLRPFRLSAVEQPLAAGDLAGLARVTAEAPETVILDESLRSHDDAVALIDARACNAFNIRVSKCGGLFASAAIAQLGHAAGLDLVVGAQVGESGILSAAGRQLAASIPEPRYVEGSGGSLLLREDLTRERVLPGFRGRAQRFRAAGLGVQVRPEVLDRLAVERRTFTAERERVA